MLSLLLAAVVSQITPEDYAKIQAEENWVIDSLQRPVRYHKYMPSAIAEQADLWDDPCYRCRKRANEAVVAMGDPALRWMFWTLRSTSPSIQLHSEACIRGLLKCNVCNGSGRCEKYIAKHYKMEKWTWEYCLVCGRSRQNHDDVSYPRECIHCGGQGIFQRNNDD